MRRLRSRCPRATRAILVAGLALAIVCGASAQAAEAELCPPFPASARTASTAAPEQLASDTSFGIAPSDRKTPRSTDRGGRIVSLSVEEPVDADDVAGEALLVLPKGPNDLLPAGFELGAGARIADSFWSPVLCSTVVRVVGPEAWSIDQLVPKVPDVAALVPICG